MFYASFHGQKVPGKSFSDRFTGFAQCERSTVHIPWNGTGTSGTRKKKYGNSTHKKWVSCKRSDLNFPNHPVLNLPIAVFPDNTADLGCVVLTTPC